VSIQVTYPFDNPDDYNFGSTIEWTANQLQLKLLDNPGQDFTEDFADNYEMVVEQRTGIFKFTVPGDVDKSNLFANLVV